MEYKERIKERLRVNYIICFLILLICIFFELINLFPEHIGYTFLMMYFTSFTSFLFLTDFLDV
jgi:hypothetical protein